MKVLVKILVLADVFLLHLDPGMEQARGLAAVLTKQHLVDHDVVGIDLVLGEILNQPFRLVKRKKLWNAHAHKRREIGIAELLLDSVNHPSEFLDLGKEPVLLVTAASHEHAERTHQITQYPICPGKLVQRLVEDLRQLQQPQRVPRRRGVEHHDGIIHLLHLLHDLAEAHGLIYSRYRARHVVQKIQALAHPKRVSSGGRTSQ
mmetsp:Transcript_11869/g.32786  ORF Transcript_11869/g.32786 Transcript_11869/m.32786 type:complete len:204 (+) Transcript_11869:619-1230(+)